METLRGYKGREFELPLKVDVYRNLRNGSMSVKARSGEHAGRVVAHLDSVVLKDVEFCVREKGWLDVQKSGTKNVHAVIRGKMVGRNNVSRKDDAVSGMYIPKKYRYFVTIDETPLDSAEMVRVTSEPTIEVWGHKTKEDAVPYAEAHL